MQLRHIAERNRAGARFDQWRLFSMNLAINTISKATDTKINTSGCKFHANTTHWQSFVRVYYGGSKFPETKAQSMLLASRKWRIKPQSCSHNLAADIIYRLAINRFSWPPRDSFPGLYPAHLQSSQASCLCHGPGIDHDLCPGSGTGHGPCHGPGTGHGLDQLGNHHGC